MLKNEREAFILKKAYEIGYAVFRIAPHISNISLRERLEGQALALIDAAAVENYHVLSLTGRSVEYLVRFGGDVGLVNLVNAETIAVEIGNLNAAIAESGNAATMVPREIPLEGIFSEKAQKAEPAIIQKNEVIEMEPAPAYSDGGIIRSAMRQSAILEKIRQSGNCRMKDIQEILPDSSERTIRYDLQTLMEQNLVERVGNGGPAVYYRVR